MWENFVQTCQGERCRWRRRQSELHPLRLIELRVEAWQQAAILSDTGGNVNDINDATGARVFQNKLINCLVAPTNFTTHPGPEVRPQLLICINFFGIALMID